MHKLHQIVPIGGIEFLKKQTENLVKKLVNCSRTVLINMLQI